MHRPVIFIENSLGGFVVQIALLYANQARTQSTAHLFSVAESTLGVLFRALRTMAPIKPEGEVF